MDMNVDKSSILIIEDHELTSFALKTTLMTTNFVGEVYEAHNAQDGFEIIKKHKPDLILMDIGLGEINGIEATRKIKEKYPEIKIVILTSHEDKEEVTACLELGINAYCTKDIKPNKLIDVIEDVLSGSMYFDKSISKYVLERNSKQNIQKEKISVKDCYNLTQKEKKVLILLASGNNNSQIAKKMDISVNTTKVHVCSILQKLNVEDRTQAAIKAIRENLIVG